MRRSEVRELLWTPLCSSGRSYDKLTMLRPGGGREILLFFYSFIIYSFIYSYVLIYLHSHYRSLLVLILVICDHSFLTSGCTNEAFVYSCNFFFLSLSLSFFLSSYLYPP